MVSVATTFSDQSRVPSPDPRLVRSETRLNGFIFLLRKISKHHRIMDENFFPVNDGWNTLRDNPVPGSVILLFEGGVCFVRC